ncbi:MAG: hypothetical protein ACTSR8_09065 [Promethearchaeota archaeon]
MSEENNQNIEDGEHDYNIEVTSTSTVVEKKPPNDLIISHHIIENSKHTESEETTEDITDENS